MSAEGIRDESVEEIDGSLADGDITDMSVDGLEPPEASEISADAGHVEPWEPKPFVYRDDYERPVKSRGRPFRTW